MKINKKEFKNLSNKERAEIYADAKIHNETYFASKFSLVKNIHEQRLNSLRILMGDVTDKKILDAGFGEGYFLSNIKAKEKIGIELSEKRVLKTRILFPDLNVQSADVRQLPFEDNNFDVIICSEVLEHVSDYEKAILEFKRCIRPNGYLVLSFPNEFTVGLGRLLVLKFPLHELDHVNSIKPANIEKLLGAKYQSLNVPRLPYPFCLYQVYRFNAIDFK